MHDTGSVQIIFAPEGYLFELIYRSRGVPLIEGVFREIVFVDGRAWGADFRSLGETRPARWRVLNSARWNEIALSRDPASS